MKTAVGFPFPQGCTVEGQTVNFSVAVPEGQTCELIIYKKGARASAFSQEMPYSDVAGNLHFLSVVLEQPEDYEYCYKIGGKIVPDPYGKAFSGREHWSVSKGKEKRKLRTRIVTDTFDWEVRAISASEKGRCDRLQSSCPWIYKTQFVRSRTQRNV